MQHPTALLFVSALTMLGTPLLAAPPTVAGLAEMDTALQSGLQVEDYVTGTKVPWAMCFLPDGRMLFTEREGRVRGVAADGKLIPEALFEVKDIRTGGEIGLMGFTPHPDFAKNKWVYIAYGHQEATGEKDARGRERVKIDVRVMRLRESEGKFIEDKLIISGFPAQSNHAGCLLRFGPDGKLYITTGEMFRRELSQDMTSLGGKTLRLNDDGSVPEDNPFVKTADARPEIWSLGHRNAQGMDWQPRTGVMYQVEHGPSGEAGTGGDELNRVEKGKNYGWPTIHHKQSQDGLEHPLAEWSPAIAPSQLLFYTGDAIPALKGKLLFTALGGLGGNKRPGVYVISLDAAGAVTGQTRILTSLGRLRAIAQGPDGALYVSTSNRDGRGRPADSDDRILRITAKPAGK